MPNQALQQTAGHDSFLRPIAHTCPAAAELCRSPRAPTTSETHGAVAAVGFSGHDEDHAMSSVQPADADTTGREQRQRRMRRVSVAMGVFAACLGLMAFSRVASNPRFEAIHTLDVIGLMTAGAGVAVAFVLLMQFFFLPGRRSENTGAGQASK
jgi:hypothetical protein